MNFVTYCTMCFVLCIPLYLQTSLSLLPTLTVTLRMMKPVNTTKPVRMILVREITPARSDLWECQPSPSPFLPSPSLHRLFHTLSPIDLPQSPYTAHRFCLAQPISVHHSTINIIYSSTSSSTWPQLSSPPLTHLHQMLPLITFIYSPPI